MVMEPLALRMVIRQTWVRGRYLSEGEEAGVEDVSAFRLERMELGVVIFDEIDVEVADLDVG